MGWVNRRVIRKESLGVKEECDAEEAGIGTVGKEGPFSG
jgi:hypothetical protein